MPFNWYCKQNSCLVRCPFCCPIWGHWLLPCLHRWQSPEMKYTRQKLLWHDLHSVLFTLSPWDEYTNMLVYSSQLSPNIAACKLIQYYSPIWEDCRQHMAQICSCPFFSHKNEKKKNSSQIQCFSCLFFHFIVVCNITLGRKNLICIIGPWTCVKQNLLCNSLQVRSYTCSIQKPFPAQQWYGPNVHMKSICSASTFFPPTKQASGSIPCFTLSVTRMIQHSTDRTN